MANKQINTTEGKNKPRVHGISLVGTVITGALAATAVSLPFFGIGGGLLMLIVGGAALASAVGFGIFRHQKRKAEKLGLAKTKVKKQRVVHEEEVDHSINERVSSLLDEERVNARPVREFALASKDIVEDEESVLEAYKVDRVGAKTFAVYEADGKTVKRDAHGEPMIYAIENDREYRRRLLSYVSSEASGDCVIKITDAKGESEDYSVPATGYSDVMTSVISKIGVVARQSLVHEPPVMEA